MNEILFRGRRPILDEWVYGSLVSVDDYRGMVTFDRDSYMYFDKDTSMVDGYLLEVDPMTVCQYVGLKDAYGDKIFEGDIIESPLKPIGHPYGQLVVINDVRNMGSMIPLLANSYKIIGNIFDNPELLKWAES